MRTVTALFSLAASACAFTVGPPSTSCIRRRIGASPSSTSSSSSSSSLRMSEPSDTASSDDDEFYEYQEVVTVESEEYEPTQSEALVTNVMDLMPPLLQEITSETRAAINEALYKLESLNPTKQPTVSPLLNGVWSLRYVGGYSSDWAMQSPTRDVALFLYSGGYSPGMFALSLAQKIPTAMVDVGDLEITISRSQPRVEASIDIKLLGGETTVKVISSLDVESDVRLKETYESATIMDNDIPIPQALQYSRDLYVTYLDEDLLVVRDASGVPEVLTRKEKSFSRNWGTDPSAFEDMAPPGEEKTY